MRQRKPGVFISYSHEDGAWTDRLVRQLQIPAQHHGFDVWHDGQVRAGDDWRERIDVALESTEIAVLLISPEFLSSKFLNTHEVPLLLDLWNEGRVAIVPVLVGACPWMTVGWLARLEMRPKNGEALESMSVAAWKHALARVAEDVDAMLTRATKRTERGMAGAAPPYPPVVVKARAAHSVSARAERSRPQPGLWTPASVVPQPAAAPAPLRERVAPPPIAAGASKGWRSLASVLMAAARSLRVWLRRSIRR